MISQVSMHINAMKRGHVKSHENNAVTPAKAGVQVFRGQWIPAFAGMTIRGTTLVFADH